MQDKELLRLTKGFMKGLLSKESSKAKCLMACWPLQSYLSMVGHSTQLTEGEINTPEGTWNHFWLTLDDKRILDPTADQFKTPDNEEMPRIYLGEKPEWYKVIG